MHEYVKLDRREFLRLGGTAGGGLVLGLYVSDGDWAEANGPFQPNAFVQIDPTEGISIWVAKAEMGQGVRTALPMIVADELDADLDSVRIVQANAHPEKYGSQMTVGSRSIRGNGFVSLRRAGAAAREMLVAAAATRWGVAASTCRTGAGRILHEETGRSLDYTAVAEAAAELPVPESPRLKDPSEFRYIGKPMAQRDTPLRVTGAAIFGTDVRVPGMRYGTVVHPPVFGGSVASFDATRALQVTGVRKVFEVSRGIAVVADNTWTAFAGAAALDVTWDDGDFSMDSSDIRASFAALAESDGGVGRDDGDASSALERATTRLEATYEVPYLAHATMEPMNCTAHAREGHCEVWAPTQNPQGTQSTAAEITGLSMEDVTVHVTFMGCGLGRRARTDYVEDAVETSMRLGEPVQVVWSREEDMQHDFYRPATYNRLEGGLDDDGVLQALKIRVVAPPLFRGRGEVDRSSLSGILSMPYSLPNCFVDNCQSDVPVVVGHWRSVGPSQNVFILESFIDELAHAAGTDPIEFRLQMLGEQPRLRHVLRLAADEAGWSSPLPSGRARGVAIVVEKGGYVAQIAEVSVDNGRPRVHKVTCAFDCGLIVNPATVEAQATGSVVTGLAAALDGAITIEGGRVVQSNFHDYPLLRIDEMPEVDVHLVDSNEDPGGAGEAAVPPIAPAVTNALFALTGTRIRSLPLSEHQF